MQTSSRGQGREITKDELLKIAPFSKGQLTKIYRAGYLPRPYRRSRPGSNEPVYFWDESIIEQAKFLYDRLQWDPSYQRARLPLWLRGYAVGFAPLKQQWLRVLDPALQPLTQSGAYDPLDIVTDIVSQLEYKWEHTPTRHRPRPIREQGLARSAWIMETFLSFLYVADFEQFEMTFATGDDEDRLPWVQAAHEILVLPHIYEAMEQATPEAWEQARQGYTTLCRLLRRVVAPLNQEGNLEELCMFLFPFWGFFLVPVALSMRHWGYGYWIDDGFAWVNNWLAKPDTQAWFTRMSELLANPEIRGRLHEPAVRLRIIQQLTEGSG